MILKCVQCYITCSFLSGTQVRLNEMAFLRIIVRWSTWSVYCRRWILYLCFGCKYYTVIRSKREVLLQYAAELLFCGQSEHNIFVRKRGDRHENGKYLKSSWRMLQDVWFSSWSDRNKAEVILTCECRRYDMSSNSPSGGMNEMVRSFSKRDNRTHWWNLTSSISTDLLRPPVNEYIVRNDMSLNS